MCFFNQHSVAECLFCPRFTNTIPQQQMQNNINKFGQIHQGEACEKIWISQQPWCYFSKFHNFDLLTPPSCETEYVILKTSKLFSFGGPYPTKHLRSSNHQLLHNKDKKTPPFIPFHGMKTNKKHIHLPNSPENPKQQKKKGCHEVEGVSEGFIFHPSPTLGRKWCKYDKPAAMSEPWWAEDK